VTNAITVLAHTGNFVRSILRRPSGSTCRSYVAVEDCRLPDRAAFDAPISAQWLESTPGSLPYRRRTRSPRWERDADTAGSRRQHRRRN
jgi:hypothetical protein